VVAWTDFNDIVDFAPAIAHGQNLTGVWKVATPGGIDWLLIHG
jgi:hypothetical protein